VDIVAGVNHGFSDTIEYETVALHADLILLSWQEDNGSTIVHALDFNCFTAYAAVTPYSGGFMRLTGPIEVKSG
jgi:molybdenum cofactor biosynthesis MoaF-like protein